MCTAIRASFKKLAVFLMIALLFAGGVSLVRADDDSSKSSKPKTKAESKKSGEKKGSGEKGGSSSKKSDEKKGSDKKSGSSSKKSDGKKAPGGGMMGGGMGGGSKTKPK